MSRRVEHIGNATLYLGDCREVLPELIDRGGVAAVVTDPPYGIGADKKHASKAGKWGWKDHGQTDWDGARPDREVFDLILAAAPKQIIWGGNYFADWLPPTMRWLVWDKGQRDFSLADCELAWTSEQKAARVYDCPRGAAARENKEHPTQKPIELMRWCLGFLPEAKTILDPFMGSGSTGVAALLEGRSFVGIERHEPYFEVACRRLRQVTGEAPGALFAQQPMFGAEQAA